MALARLYSMPLASLSVYLLADVMASKRSPPCGQILKDRGVSVVVYGIDCFTSKPEQFLSYLPK